jgi:hypothetical protein
VVAVRRDRAAVHEHEQLEPRAGLGEHRPEGQELERHHVRAIVGEGTRRHEEHVEADDLDHPLDVELGGLTRHLVLPCLRLELAISERARQLA